MTLERVSHPSPPPQKRDARHGSFFIIPFLHDAALFSERAAFFYDCTDNKPRSTAAFRKARELYLKWGATRKAADLEALC